MKVAIFSEAYLPYVSGVVRSVHLLKTGLEQLGHEVVVFAPSYPGHTDTEKNIVRLPSVASAYPGFRLSFPVPGTIAAGEFDIIHSNSPFQLGKYSQVLARKYGVPFVYTFHTLFTEYLHYIPAPQFISKIVVGRMIRKFCNRCDCIITPNKMTSEYIRSFRVRTRIELVPTGIDPEAASRADGGNVRERLGLNRSSGNLIYVGRLSREKNVDFLIRTFAKALPSVPSAYLLIVGKGPEENSLKALCADMGITNNVIFCGEVPYPQVLDHYKAGDVFVFSSKTETQGLVIAEAKSCGLPVIALDEAGIKESICDGEDGFLVACDDISGFSGRIVQLLNNRDLLAMMSSNAKRNASRDFSCLNIAKKIESVYTSIERPKKRR